MITCADPGIFVRWGLGQSDKKALTTSFGGSNVFQGGGGGGGSNCLFPIETHITCDFPGGVRTPCPPSGSALVYQQTTKVAAGKEIVAFANEVPKCFPWNM